MTDGYDFSYVADFPRGFKDDKRKWTNVLSMQPAYRAPLMKSEKPHTLAQSYWLSGINQGHL